MKSAATLLVVLIVAGCTPPPQMESIYDYRPIVDLANIDEVKYESDLAECIKLGAIAQAEIMERAEEEHKAKEWIEFWNGPQPRIYNETMLHFAPRRVVDRCMEKRGHPALNIHGYD